MNEQQSYLAKCALFFLRKLYPNENCEPLVGDLLEQLSEGQSTGWLWRQVLVALGATAFSRLRLILPEISVFAAAATAICVFPWGLILPVELMDKQSGTEWIPTVLAADILSVLMISPLFAALLILRNAFTWAQALRTSAFTLALLLGGDALLREWVLHHAVQHPSNALLLVRLQVLCITVAVLIPTVFARRPSVKSKSAIAS